MIGAFLVPAARLAELGRVLDDGPAADPAADPVAPLDLGVIVGPESLAATVRSVRADPRLRSTAVEVAPSDTAPARTLDVVRAEVAPDVAVAVEVPRDARRDAVLDALVGSGFRAKLRTGGVHAAAFPSARELALVVAGCRDRGIAVKATAGLHRAVRHVDPVSGFVHHGFLNLLLAADTAAGGGGVAEIETALDERDADAVASAVAAVGPGSPRFTAARALFTSFGTCSVDEPIADLRALGLLEPARQEVSS